MLRSDRPVASLGIALALIASALLLHVAPAGAAIGYKQLPLTFGSSVLVRPTSLTVEQANGNVYVTSNGSNELDLFGMEGGSPAGGLITPITGPTELPFHFGGEEPSEVAIDESDESGDPSNGDLYVSDSRNGVVDKFKPTGLGGYTYVCRFVGYGQGCVEKPTTTPTWNEPDGVAVDSHGNVYIASFGPETGAVYEFNPEGRNVREFSGEDIGTRGHETGPVDVAVDANNNIYINNYHNSIVKINSSGHQSLLDEGGSRGVAVDSHGNVFVDDSSAIVEYNELGEEVNRFGEGALTPLPSEGIAVNNSTGDVYVSIREAATILAFGQVTVPSVITGGSSEAKGTTAKVAGSVNPEGIEAHYLVEYGPCNENRLTNCSESPYSEATAEIALPEPSGTNPEPVEAMLTGLSPETAYHYRLVGTNANGNKHGKEATFTTGPAVAGLSTTVASSLQPASATLNGQLNPEGALAHYFFEYVSEAKYNPGAPNPYSEGVSTEGSPSELSGNDEETASTPITGLEFGTTYHYRIVAYNEHGFTFGQDHTMTTLPALPIVDDQRPSFTTSVGRHEALLHGTVNPGRGVTAYTFLYESASENESGSTPGAFTQANDEDNQVESTIVDLQPDTLYYYVLLATNATGTVESEEGEFTTLPEEEQHPLEGGGGQRLEAPSTLIQPLSPGLLPTPGFPAIKSPPPGSHPAGCKKGFVRKHGRCVKRKATKKAAPHRKRLSR
jgi:hypothetical protein